MKVMPSEEKETDLIAVIFEVHLELTLKTLLGLNALFKKE